jgi:hypothetical protein
MRPIWGPLAIVVNENVSKCGVNTLRPKGTEDNLQIEQENKMN